MIIRTVRLVTAASLLLGGAAFAQGTASAPGQQTSPPPRAGTPAQTPAPPRPSAPTPSQAPAPAPSEGSAPRPTATTGGSVPLVPEYQLQPGDKLRIDVYKDEQLSQSVQIRPDGKVTMPLIGDVMASGLTPVALRDQLTTALRDYVNNPVVTVVVVEATTPVAFVAGEVAHPGTITLQRRVTVLQALALSGGLKDFADTKGIYVLRAGEDGRQVKIPYNYKSALKGENVELYLQPNDTLVVP